MPTPEETVETKLARIERMANQGLKPGAAQLSRLILERDPRNVQALVWLARTTKQPEEAERATRQAEALAPDDPMVRELLTERQPASVGTAQSANPFGSPSAAPFQSYAPPPGAADFNPNTFDYLQMLNSTPVSSATAAPPISPARPTKAARSGGRASLIFGLLFLLVGVALGVYWTLSVLSFNSDATASTHPISGQVTSLSSSELQLDAKDSSKRTYSISNQVYSTLAPLISDSKNTKSLVPNAVTLNVTPADRLATVDVQSPNKGSSANNLTNGLLGINAALDWVLTGLCVVLALVGLILLGRSFARPKA